MLVIHKELEYKVEKLKYKNLEVIQPRIRIKNPIFQLVNKTTRVSPREVLQSWLIDTVQHLLVKNDKSERGA